MDAFAENQMGRNDEANNSMLDVTQAAAIQAKRLRRSSKEQEMDAVAVEVSEELLAPSSAGADDDNDDPMEDVDMPTMSMDESAVIARKWERRKSRARRTQVRSRCSTLGLPAASPLAGASQLRRARWGPHHAPRSGR